MQIPGGSDLYGYYVDFESRRLESWDKRIPEFKYNPEVLVLSRCTVLN